MDDGSESKRRRTRAAPETGARAAQNKAPSADLSASLSADDDAPRANGASLAPGLYLLATPIGAFRDLTLRGRDALATADALACEDTRVLRRLLDLHGLSLRGRPLIAYHDHSGEAERAKILGHLEAGRSVVYASDAGTPLIADPGYRLAEAARAAGFAVAALPGPSAVLAALTSSGLPTDRFSFGGFLPPKPGARRRALETWATTPGSLVFFESPRRLADSLADMLEILGDRPAALARELTKRHEEIRRGPLAALARALADEDPPKGELVVVLGPPAATPADDQALDAALTAALREGSLKDAVRTVAEHLALPRRLVYARAVVLRDADQT